MTADVSVVVPCHNHDQYVATCLASIGRQTVQPIEIIVVDDGSDDKSVEVAQRFGARVISQERAGPACARNRGIREAAGKWTLPVDADDRLAPDCIRRLMEQTYRADMVAPAVQDFGDSYEMTLLPPEDFLGLSRFLERNWLGPSCLFSRELWDRAGGYDEHIRGWEDWDLWIRMLATGARLAVVNEPLYWYRIHADSRFRSRPEEENAKIRAYMREKYEHLGIPEGSVLLK